MSRIRLLAVASHPIQYHAPWFRQLAQVPHIDFQVLFMQQPDADQQGRGFGIRFAWDIPVLEGYSWTVAQGVRGPGGLGGFFAARLADPEKLIRNFSPDTVLLTGWHTYPLVQVLRAAHRLRIPVIMRGEANALRPRPWPVRAGHRALLRRCSAFLPIGRASRDFYLSYSVPPDRLFEAPYCVDNARFSASAASAERERAAYRERWGIAEDATCFCYAGKLESKKRILDLLAALRQTTETALPIHLLVVGTGELMGEAQEYARDHALPVTFAGFLNQSEIPAAYAASDCLVLPSDYGETWGLVVNEAMACGRPALVSDRVGCAQDLVIPGITGAVFPFGDVPRLAHELQQLARDPVRLREMGAQARAHVTDRYSIERSVSAVISAANYVLKRR